MSLEPPARSFTTPSPTTPATHTQTHIHVRTRPWGEARAVSAHRMGQPGALWLGSRLPGGGPGALGTHSPYLPLHIPGLPPAPLQVPLPTSQRLIPLIPSKGPISLSCSQLRGCLLSSRGTVPQFVLPPPYLISVTPIPICFPAHSHTHPLSWLSKLSASLSSPAGGGVGGGAGWGGGGWPLRGLGKGDMGGGGPGCSSEKGKEGKRGERERQRQRQAASQPALYPCRIDLPCHSPGR